VNDAQRQNIAMFRFGVIGPLISGELTHGELKSRIRELCSRRYTIPFSHKTSIGFGTIEEWLHKYRKKGMDGLMPGVRADKGTVRAIRPELKEAIITLKKEDRKRSVRSILNHLVKTNGMKPHEISKTTTYRILGLALPKYSPSVTGKEQKRFVHQYPNQCWQGDVMHGPYIKDGKHGKEKKTYLIAFIDDASRLIVGAQFFFAEITANIKTVLRDAVLTYGVPAKLYPDNGRNFCADDIRIACAKMSTALIHTTPYYPQGKGKIERWFKTVRTDFLPWLKAVESLNELNLCFDAWLQEKYNRAPHSALENATPLDTFLRKIEWRMRRLPDHIDDAELFCRKETRIVAPNGTFRINNMLYDAEEQLIGKKSPYSLIPTIPPTR
jgi:transposase InsO family protein